MPASEQLVTRSQNQEEGLVGARGANSQPPESSGSTVLLVSAVFPPIVTRDGGSSPNGDSYQLLVLKRDESGTTNYE